MLQSLLIVTSALGIFSLTISFFTQKKGGRIILQLLSAVLFIAAALGSFQVQDRHCFFDATNFTNTNCITSSTFDEQSAWTFGGLAVASLIIGFLTMLQQAPETSENIRGDDF